jgi:hypothetical protein
MKAIRTNLIITGIRAKVDGSLGLSATTPELTPEEKAEFMRLQGHNLDCLFNPLDQFNAPEYKVDKEIDSKTPSQRLRNTLYIFWEQSGSKGDFNEFYKSEYEKVIEHYKSKLI